MAAGARRGTARAGCGRWAARGRGRATGSLHVRDADLPTTRSGTSRTQRPACPRSAPLPPPHAHSHPPLRYSLVLVWAAALSTIPDRSSDDSVGERV
jgi:hypothetical protein